MASFHLVESDGTVYSAGAALAKLMARLPGGGLVGRAADKRPAVTEALYRLVAGNRDRLGPLIPDAVKDRATKVIDRRA
jgi:predicted DCC family thiol-disulfide oxidoreductase YuxK